MSSHTNTVIATPLIRCRLVRWIRAGPTGATQVRIAFAFRRKARTRLGATFATLAGTSPEKVPTLFTPHTVLGTKEGILDAAAILFRAWPHMIAGSEKGMNLGIFHSFEPRGVVTLHGLSVLSFLTVALGIGSYMLKLRGLDALLCHVVGHKLSRCIHHQGHFVNVSLVNEMSSFANRLLKRSQLLCACVPLFQSCKRVRQRSLVGTLVDDGACHIRRECRRLFTIRFRSVLRPQRRYYL